jgi:hypothetical protein
MMQQSIGGVSGEGNRIGSAAERPKVRQFYFVYVSRDRLASPKPMNMSAKMEAVNELRVSLEAKHQSTVSLLEQSHEEETRKLVENHGAEMEEVKSNSLFALDELRSEEETKLASELER